MNISKTNIPMQKLIDIFLINSEILLRASSRNIEIGNTCTSGYLQPLCKSFYSTRCALTVDVFNSFFCKKILFHLNKTLEKLTQYNTIPFEIKKNLDNISQGIVFTPIPTHANFYDFNVDIAYDSMDFLNKNYDDFLKEFDKLDNKIITINFNNVPFYYDYIEETLVGHIFNLIINDNKYYLIQSYMYKYSPVCIEISVDEFRDYLLIYYMLTKNCVYICNEPSVDYNFFILNNIRSMYIIFDNNLYINPWFNELYFKSFQDYYYNPYDISGNKIFSQDSYYNRPYVISEISIYELNDSYLSYYNMLNYLYNYYNIISYDIYSYKNFNNDASKTFLVQRNTNNDFNENTNPTFYKQTIDDDINRHKMISFWENNLFIQLSNIISDKNLDKIDESSAGEYLFDMYLVLLYSTKNSISYTHNAINENKCSKSTLLDELEKYNLFTNFLKLKFIVENLNIDSNLMSDSYLPIFNLLSCLDMYDYYNTQTCIIYDFLIQIVYNMIVIYDFKLNDFFVEFVKNVDKIDEEILNDKQKRLYYYILICTNGSNGLMDEYNPTEYDNFKINALINIILISFSFFILERVFMTINEKYQKYITNDFLKDSDVLIEYIDFINIYYKINDIYIDESIREIFIYIYDEIKSIYDNDYIDNKIFSLDPFIKSSSDYIDFLLYYLTKENNIDLDSKLTYNLDQYNKYLELLDIFNNIII